MLALGITLLFLQLNNGGCVTISIEDPTTNLAHLVSDCSYVRNISSEESESGTMDSSATNNISSACETMDIILYTDLLLDTPVTFLDLTYTSIQGVHGIVNIMCTSTGAGLIFLNTTHIELSGLRLIGCAVIKDYTNTNAAPLSLFSSALHIVYVRYVSVSNVSVEESAGAGMLLAFISGTASITDSNFTANWLPDSAPGSLYGGGGVYLYIQNNPHSQFQFMNCIFEKNIAENTFNFSFVFADEFGEPILGRGRGGGIIVNMRSNVTNNSVTVSDCFFADNTAFGGGGLSIEMEEGNSYHNHILIKRSVFFRNGCKQGRLTGRGSGGGVQASFFTLDPFKPNRNNAITFQGVTFRQNCGLLGGGIYFFSNIDTDLNTNNQLLFDNCTWVENYAHAGSAVDFAPSIFERLNSGYGTVPVFRDCVFFNNTVANTVSDQQHHYGTGTLYSSLYDIKFESSVEFSHNFGTAVFVVNAVADFTNSSALFDSNEGTQGGGVALIGSSSMMIGPHNYIFTNNIASDRGGAIYSFLIDTHDFLVSRSCFMQYQEVAGDSRFGVPLQEWGIPSTQWKARVHFEGNLAHSKHGHDIFTTSLLPCQVVNTGAQFDTLEFQVLEHVNIFQPPGVTFGGHVDGLRISTDGAGFANSTEHLLVIPGENFEHGINVVDDLNQPITSMLAGSFPFHKSNIELDDTTFLTNQIIQFRGTPHEEDTLVVQAMNTRRIFQTLGVELLECPPGFKHTVDHCKCDHEDIVRCDDKLLHSYLQVGYWIGYINDNETILVTANCPLHFCKYINSGNKSRSSVLEVVLPQSRSREDLERVVCGVERSGILCGKCNEGYAVHYHSPSLECVQLPEKDTCNALGWLFYILSEIVPATILFVVVLIFNISFTSGALNGFILFSQLFDTLLIDASGAILFPDNVKYAIDAIRFVYGFFNLDFFYLRGISFCLWKGASALDILAFKYLTIAYSVFLIAGVIIFMKYCGARCLGKYYRMSVMRNSVIQGLSTFLVMCYAQCVKVSFSLLYSSTPDSRESNITFSKRVLYNGEIEFFSPSHLPYALPALAVLFIIGVIPLVILLTYPAIFRILNLFKVPETCVDKCLPSFSALKPFLDVFQGSFKDNFRFFAGIYFLYRWVGVLIYATSESLSIFYSTLEVALITMLVLHALAQPYLKKWHNVLDALIFADLALINNLTAVHYYASHMDRSYQKHLPLSLTVQVILIYLPALYLAIYLIIQIAKKTCFKKTVSENMHGLIRRVSQGSIFSNPSEESTDRRAELDESGGLPYRLMNDVSTTVVSVN